MKNKYCRICWNSAGWQKPTGEAPSLETASFTALNGFGVEEWLFNYDWLIDGYRYGFLQPINKYRSKYVGETCSVLLYTISPDSGTLMLGIIKEIYVPDDQELATAMVHMQQEGWIDQMKGDVREVGGNLSEITPEQPPALINIRFRPEDVQLFSPIRAVPAEHKIRKVGRYIPLDWERAHIGHSSPAAPTPLEDIETHAAEFNQLDKTERESIVQSRIGQGRYKLDLMALWGGCAVTNLQDPSVVRASHAKPWRDATNAERLDPHNGLPLIPNLDVLFDRGLITFGDDGVIFISPGLSAADLAILGVHSELRLRRVFPGNIPFLQYHRENVFQG